MKQHSYVRDMVLSGLFIALGIVLPMAFHSVKGGGPIFLPMHLPILLGGLLVTPPFAIGIGLLTPLLSNLFTSMPPTFPMLPIMMVELAVYAFICSLVHVQFKLNYVLALVCAMVLGRLAAGVVVYILISAFSAKIPSVWLFMSGAVTKGLPGIIGQLILIPIIMYAVENYTKKGNA